jgi:hypothetical protein
MCDAKPWQLAMKIHGNRDENVSQDQTYDVDVVCVTKNHGKLRRTFVPIATIVQNKNLLPTNYRRNCDDDFMFTKKKKITRDMVLPYYIVIWYTILQCNMVMPYYIVIWYYHITL